MSRLRVLICSPPSVLREGIRVVLERQEDFLLVGGATFGHGRTAEIGRLAPDIIIVSSDIIRPARAGFLAGLRQVDPDLVFRVVVFGRIADPADAIDCMRAGVSGFVEEDVPCDLIPAKLRQFAAGRPVLGAATISILLDAVTKDSTPSRDTDLAALAKLTSQERRVLTLMGQGIPTAKMAMILQLGETTVRTHVHRMKHKLGLRTRDQLIAFAARSTRCDDPART